MRTNRLQARASGCTTPMGMAFSPAAWAYAGVEHLVVTEARAEPNVAGLVCTAAFAPDPGESGEHADRRLPRVGTRAVQRQPEAGWLPVPPNQDLGSRLLVWVLPQTECAPARSSMPPGIASRLSRLRRPATSAKHAGEWALLPREVGLRVCAKRPMIGRQRV